MFQLVLCQQCGSLYSWKMPDVTALNNSPGLMQNIDYDFIILFVLSFSMQKWKAIRNTSTIHGCLVYKITLWIRLYGYLTTWLFVYEHRTVASPCITLQMEYSRLLNNKLIKFIIISNTIEIHEYLPNSYIMECIYAEACQ